MAWLLMDQNRDPDPVKMRRLAYAAHSPDLTSVEYAISMLDDVDIRIRGEAFCSLLLSKNNIAGMLERRLTDPSHNIRAFCALVLANRGDSASAPNVVPLLDDRHAVVRSCALGALGYLRYAAAVERAAKLLDDESLEVRRSAEHAVSEMRL